MIALIIGMPSAAGLNLVKLSGDQLARPSHLQLVKSLPVTTGVDGMQTVAEFAAARGADLALPVLNAIGRRASSLMRKQDRQPVKVECPMFGFVNAYPVEFLAQAFDHVTGGAA